MQAAFSRERIAEIAETLRRLQEAYSPERTAETLRRLQEAYSPERMAETLRRLQEAYSPERMAETLRRLQEAYSPGRMRAIGEALESSLGAAAGARIAPALADWQAEVGRADAASPPEPEEGRTVAAWLYLLPIPYQLGILHAGLACIVAVTTFLEEAGNTDVPDELQAATAMMMSVMIFIVVLLQARTGPPDE